MISERPKRNFTETQYRNYSAVNAGWLSKITKNLLSRCILFKFAVVCLGHPVQSKNYRICMKMDKVLVSVRYTEPKHFRFVFRFRPKIPVSVVHRSDGQTRHQSTPHQHGDVLNRPSVRCGAQTTPHNRTDKNSKLHNILGCGKFFLQKRAIQTCP